MEKSLRKWLFLFLEEDGLENRRMFLHKFVFFINTTAVLLEVDEQCFLGGVIYGNSDKFNPGAKVITSSVKKIEKKDDGKIVFSTATGGQYNLFLEEADYFTKNLLRDIIEVGEINEQKWFYLPRDFSFENFL